MTAYEHYLVMLSEKAIEQFPDMTQEEALELLIKEALFQQEPMAYEVMTRAGEDCSYQKDSFIKAAQYLLKEHDAYIKSSGN